jgi:hypothetical protein
MKTATRISLDQISPASLVLAISAMLLLVLLGSFNYLLFHTIAEVFSIVVACGIFMFVWSARHFMEDNSLQILGVAFLFIAGLDLIHTLTCQGMGILSGTGTNESVQLWIASRQIEAMALLSVPLLAGSQLRINLNYVLLSMSAVSMIIVASILYWPVFPDCFISGSGLTPFKMISETAVVLILASAAWLIYIRREQFSAMVRRMLLYALLLKIISELAFIADLDIYGFFNMGGLLLKILSCLMIYLAVVRTGLVRPFDLLFHHLKVRERERDRLIDQLQEALGEVKTLSGMLPICACCKQIRDDKGYWHQVEEYIRTNTETEFTHSYCPDCSRKLLESLE